MPRDAPVSLNGEQIFDRDTAEDFLRSVAVESGDVNPDVS
jgi:hypothetical protein